MKKTLEPYQLIERSIIKKYRKELWTPFIVAVKRYELVQAGDRIAVCISGGKDSMLMAKLLQELQRHSDVPFELVFLVMDPGYNEINRQKIESNAELLYIPVTIFESNIFAVANNTDKNPCYLCARMRRGHLYSKAKELGCNKIALGHHFNDVIETTVMSMFYGSQLQAMPPKLHSTSFPGMTLIRPMYCIHEEDILAWKRYNELEIHPVCLPFHRKLHHVRQRRRRFQAAGGQDLAAPPEAGQSQHRKQYLPQHPCRGIGHHARLQVRGHGAQLPGAVQCHGGSRSGTGRINGPEACSAK